MPGWVGAALTKPGRISTARWFGSGERDGKEYPRNPRYYVSQVSTGLNLADMGRERCATCRALSGAWREQLLGGSGRSRREVMVNVHGVTMTRPQGQSGTPPPSERISVNVGTVPVLTPFPGNQHGAGVGFAVDRSG